MGRSPPSAVLADGNTSQRMQAFNNFQQTQLNSLGRQVREYIRRNDLQDSRRIVQDMLTDASNLLAFFKENGVVTNSAFQTTLGLRLSLLLELLQLDQLIGESDAVLTRAEDNIRAQARDGRLALEQWAATFEPVTNDVSVRISRPCASLNPGGRCAARSTRRADITVCMDISSPRLEKPDRFCLPRQCSSNHIFLRVRNNRIDRCLQSTEFSLSADVRTHADDVGIQQFRKRNEATIFGEGFRLFLARLQEAEDAAFVDVSTTESIPELPIEPVEE